LKRRKELDTSQASIEALIEHLDQEKDEAIERTFKQVSKEFATIFEKLVPAGHGRLVIQRRADRSKNRNNDESDEEPTTGVESYTGVGISVSFNSKVMDEQQKIQQLSGGQKSKLTQFPNFEHQVPPCLTIYLDRFVRPLPHLCPPGCRIEPLCHF
jgi:structural maintenance of chromosome 3 (chondroitin sulfate proteoglycan 6)